MALMPKRVKHRKSQRGRIRGDATRGNRVVLATTGCRPSKAGGSALRRSRPGVRRAAVSRTEGRLYPVFPHKSITSIPLETRMGKGKGEPEYWAAVVKPGTVMFEVGEFPKRPRGSVSPAWPIKCRGVRFVRRRTM